RREGVSAEEIAPAQVVDLLELELNSAFDRVLFERDRQVILIFDAVAVVEIRGAVRTAAEECIGHIDGQASLVSLLIGAFALVLKTSFLNHLRVDDPGLGQPQVVVRVIAVRCARIQHVIVARTAAEAAEAAASTAEASSSYAAAEGEAEAAAEAVRE